jgi:hypothetical protein
LRRPHLQIDDDADADAGHRLAQKYHRKRLRQSMKDQFSEAGMLSISFATQAPIDGVLMVDM